MGHRYVLGLHTSHDASACLIRDGRIAVAIERERLTRAKHDWGTSGLDQLADYCLAAEGIILDSVERIAVCDYGNVTKTKVFDDRELLIGHHLAHAWAAVSLSGFDECAVMIVDGEGSRLIELSEEERLVCDARDDHLIENCSYYHWAGAAMRPVRKFSTTRGAEPAFWGTDGIASTYRFLSQLLFDELHQESKVMGLAAYGKPIPELDDIFGLRDDGVVIVDPAWTFRLHGVRANRWDLHADLYANLAATVQSGLEKALLHQAEWLRAKTGSARLVFAGGVALNCVANSRLANSGIFKDTYIPFGAGDSSIALGCAYYAWHTLGATQSTPPATAYLGRPYTDDEVEQALREFVRLRLVEEPSAARNEDIAESLAAGSIVARFSGRSEFGPRALGNRSILASPLEADVRETLNRKVKYREPYRPFAPCVLADHAGDWFEEIVPGGTAMQFVARVREDRRPCLPAITHVDGSARLQLLRRADNPELYELIAAFHSLTGVPMLLNTSFNVAEPIVETPWDALTTFACSNIDALLIEDRVLRRSAGRARDGADLASSLDALVLVWHEEIALRVSLKGPAQWFMVREVGSERFLRHGWHVHAMPKGEIGISQPLFDFLMLLRPQRGQAYELASICDGGAWQTIREELKGVILDRRVATLLRRPLQRSEQMERTS